MQTTESYPSQVLAALTKIESSLPLLVGESEWLEISKQVNQALVNLRSATDPDQQAILALELIDLLSHYPAADRRLHRAIDDNSKEQLIFTSYLHLQIKPILLEIAIQYDIKLVEVEQVLQQLLESTYISLDDSVTKGVMLSQGGVDGGKLMGLNYLDVDFFNMSVFLSAAIMTGDSIVHNPWLLP
ncbi:MAG: hypothetical protein R2932_23245 [Caldilineaceae bacterium]